MRGSRTYLEATIRFPFNSKNSFKKDGVRSRLDETPERDIDIVSNEAITDDGINELILNAATGSTQNVIHVDNTAGGGGDGSIENPFNTLAGAEAVATTNDLIYVHRGDGTTTGQDAGITIDDEGQMLAGSGTDLLFSSGRFKTGNNQDVTGGIVVATQTTAPVITNGAGDGVNVAADNVLVTGITVDGATGSGIDIADQDNITIDGVVSDNNGVQGINAFIDPTESATGWNILNNSVSNNASIGITVGSNGAFVNEVKILNNIADNNGSIGIVVAQGGSNAAYQNILIDSNTVTNNNTTAGILVSTVGITSNPVDNVTISNNIVSNNTGVGIYTRANSAGTLNNINIKNNVSNLNTTDGYFVESTPTGGNVDVRFSGNEATGNNRGIVIFDDSPAGVITADLGGGVLGSAGGNRVFGNTAQELSVDIDGAELSAENNWWGTASGLLPGETELLDGSTVDAEPFLFVDPQ